MKDENKYFYANSKMLAQTIRFLTGQGYIEIPHKSKDGRVVFSFHDNEVIQSALKDIMEIRSKYQ